MGDGGKSYGENGGLRADVEFVGDLGEPVQQLGSVLKVRGKRGVPMVAGRGRRGCAARRPACVRGCDDDRESTARRAACGGRRLGAGSPAMWEGEGRVTLRGGDDWVVCCIVLLVRGIV